MEKNVNKAKDKSSKVSEDLKKQKEKTKKYEAESVQN